MQARRRCRDRARLACKHGLVALGVRAVRLALDVRRQGQSSSTQQQLLQGFVTQQTQTIELAIATQHLELATGIEMDARAGLGRLADTQLRTGFMTVDDALNQNFDPATTVLGTE